MPRNDKPQGKDYQTLPIEKLCSLAQMGEEEVDWLLVVEETAKVENGSLLYMMVRKIRRVLGECAEWMACFELAKTERNHGWVEDCTKAIHDLCEEYYDLVDRVSDIAAKILAAEDAKTAGA